MNKCDQDNLNFLLTASKEAIVNWYRTVGERDHEYAMQLLHQYSIELEQKSWELLLDCEDEIEDLTLANQVLTKFR